jgi:hypothetical protein
VDLPEEPDGAEASANRARVITHSRFGFNLACGLNKTRFSRRARLI